MNDLEMIMFNIISTVGSARSMYINAVREAKKGNINEAKKMITDGEELFAQGHKAHSELIQKDSAGELKEITLLLVHAEDQLMSAEGLNIVANELIDVYERIS
jgi:PTS system cellobiose-specific IIA component